MGDRRTVICHSSKDPLRDQPLGIYTHWHGTEAKKVLADTVKFVKREDPIRLSDPSYFARILCDAFSRLSPGTTGVGLVARPTGIGDDHPPLHWYPN